MRAVLPFAGALLLVACAHPPAMRGANFMQSSGVPWESPPAADSLHQLRGTGATWVALVPFIRLESANGCAMRLSAAARPEPLRQAIRQARAAGLQVALKPQVSVPGAWAGRVVMPDEAQWACWFENYRRLVGQMAAVAAAEGVALFVIGTELKQTEQRPEWRAVVAAVRREFSGELSYTFHADEDIRRFTALAAIDSVGLSIYPAIGNDPDAIRQAIAQNVRRLRELQRTLPVPFWIAEVGVPSRRGAGDHPWQWDEHAPLPRQPDLALQAVALDAWLTGLRGSWLRGVMLWAWMSDPAAGGAGDTDFTPQNKPAEAVIRRHWAGRGTIAGSGARPLQ